MQTNDAQAFMSSIEAATHLLEFSQGAPQAASLQQQSVEKPNNVEEPPPAKLLKLDREEQELAEVVEFMDSLAASTYGMDMTPLTLPKESSAEDKQVKAVEEQNTKEEEAAIDALFRL